jgi:hypothetical protein
LQQLAPGQTKLAYTAASQIGGKLAQIGGRLIDAAAAATADKFFEAFAARLPASTATAPAQPGSLPEAKAAQPGTTPRRTGFWSWLLAFFRHLFARKA